MNDQTPPAKPNLSLPLSTLPAMAHNEKGPCMTDETDNPNRDDTFTFEGPRTGEALIWHKDGRQHKVLVIAVDGSDVWVQHWPNKVTADIKDLRRENNIPVTAELSSVSMRYYKAARQALTPKV